MTRRSWVSPAAWLAVVMVYAALSSIWTDTTSPWYRSLTEPPWQPPDVVFGIICAGLTVYTAWMTLAAALAVGFVARN